MFIRLKNTLNKIRTNWRSNYRYHGGILAVLKCLLGGRKLKRLARQVQPHNGIDVFTFSIVPALTQISMQSLTHNGLSHIDHRVYIGDCSGGIRNNSIDNPRITVIPYLNEGHGQKLDHFVHNLAKGGFVLVWDDDIFCLDRVPIDWALDLFSQDPKIAAVSFVPRSRFKWEINGQKHQPMGSYCLMIRRSIWEQQGLSFQQVYQPSGNPNSFRGQYDTADYANVQLIKRGYKVIIAPDEIRAHLIAYKGVSGVALRVQRHAGAGLEDYLRTAQENYFEAVCVLKKFFSLPLGEYGIKHSSSTKHLQAVNQAYQILKSIFCVNTLIEVENKTEQNFERIIHSLKV